MRVVSTHLTAAYSSFGCVQGCVEGGGDVYASVRDFEQDPTAQALHIRVHYLERSPAIRARYPSQLVACACISCCVRRLPAAL